jgi:protein TonB
MRSIAHPTLSANPSTTLFPAKLIVISLVFAFHGLVLFFWHKPHIQSFISINEMSASFELAASVTPAKTQVQRKSLPVAVPLLEKTSPQLQPAQSESQAEAITTPAASPSATVLGDSEPIYKVSYLNNTPPAYPLAARRMGLQGRVVLQVEVLAAGRCGRIAIQTSSGYAMLDNAALEAVKSWRFVPARQAGNAVDKWFIIPVQFSLKDNA